MIGIKSRATMDGKHCYVFLDWDAVGERWATILGLPGSKSFPFFTQKEALQVMFADKYSHDDFEIVADI